MSHTIRADLTNLKSLAAALKDLEWYTSPSGGYRVAAVAAEGNAVAWELETRPVEAKAAPARAPEQRKTVEPGDKVIVETKAQQVARRFGDAEHDGVEGVVFRVLTRGPHPHGMKVELRDRTVGRVLRNLTMPGAGEPK
ncbi:MAG TPA: DUF2196 domain-containing protein [Symbiobacteriaceae bacterium]|nr:DUF2196 domain-containing protein [Symbiobacteriaceae bacterium]